MTRMTRLTRYLALTALAVALVAACTPLSPAPVAPPWVGDSPTHASSWAPTRRNTDGTPVKWEACQIRVAVNHGGDMAFWADVTTALLSVEQASGVLFEFVGFTGHVPTLEQPVAIDSNSDVTIAQAASSETNLFAASGLLSAAGVGTPYYRWAQPGHLRIGAGSVVIAPGVTNRVHVIEHEIGHVLGLAHTDNATQIMTSQAITAPGWGSGDRAGLQAVGGRTC